MVVRMTMRMVMMLATMMMMVMVAGMVMVMARMTVDDVQSSVEALHKSQLVACLAPPGDQGGSVSQGKTHKKTGRAQRAPRNARQHLPRTQGHGLRISLH